MKSKKLLSLILSTCLLSPAYQPLFISAEENQTVSGDICTKNPEYEARKEAVAEAGKNLEAAGAEKDAAVKVQDQASKDLDAAQIAKAESEKKLDEANKALDVANKDVENAEKALETVKSDAVQANTNLEDAKKAEKAAQKALDNATQAQKDAEQARDAAQTADNQAKTDVENAEQAVADAKAALEKARSQETASALGFFESLGTQDALDAAEMLKYFAQTNNDYSDMNKSDSRGVTILGGEKDATNLDFMLKAIQMMRIGNEKRAEAGVDPTDGSELSELKVSVVMWAQAMAYANMEAYTEYHWMGNNNGPVVLGCGENLALGRIDHAYEGWYDEEKELYDFVQKYLAEHPGATEDDAKDAAKKAGIVSHSGYSYGHYTSLLYSGDTATGFGYTTNGSRGAATQQFGGNTYIYKDGSMYGETRYAHLYTLDEMETLLTGYKNSIDAKIAEAQANLDRKQAELEALMAKKETTAAQLKAAIDAVTEAATKVTEAKSDLGEKTGNRERLEAIASTANAQIAAQENIVNDKKAEAQKKADAVKDAQVDVDAKDAAIAAAQSALDAATANVKAKEMSVEKAKADLKTAQDALNATGHTWKETVVKEPNCTTEGLKNYICENCGETKQETLPALGHDYSKDWTIDKEATCEEPGEADWTFADIDAGSPHAEEVLWLAHSGVSKGWDEGNGTTTFRPLTKVARCDMAAFLRRLVG